MSRTLLEEKRREFIACVHKRFEDRDQWYYNSKT